MMRSVVVGVVAAVLGAASFWAIDRFSAGGEDPETVQTTVVAAAPAKPQLVGPGASAEERVADGLAEPQNPPPAGSPPPLPPARAQPSWEAPPSGTATNVLPIAASDGGQTGSGTATARGGGPAPATMPGLGAMGSAFEAQRRRALETYDSGDRARGLRLLEGVYALGKHRPGVDLTPEVGRLLQDAMSFEQRVEYVDYLKRRGGTGHLFERRWEQAVLGLSNVEGGKPSAAVAAWEDLSLAYELAEVPGQRAQIMGHLGPLLERLVFSGRYSPLLTTYTVQPGDNLSQIAEKFGTTVDGIRRLNGLKGTVIQPRRRLRLLEGKVHIFVDKSEFRLWMTVGGRLLLERPVGLGRDNGTPVGEFEIRVRQKDPSWWKPGEPAIPAGDPRNVLGTRWLGFRDTEELAGFGIHGTADALSIGTESSAGCIRLQNEDVELLYDFVPIGTKVVVRS